MSKPGSSNIARPTAIRPRTSRLLGVCLTDLPRRRPLDGLFLLCAGRREALARHYMILDHIERARRLGLPHVYLGYWVEGSRKMAYKARFLPQERLGMDGWQRVD